MSRKMSKKCASEVFFSKLQQKGQPIPLFLCNNYPKEGKTKRKEEKTIAIKEISEARKKQWLKHKSVQKDSEFTKSAAYKILSTPSLVREARDAPHLLIEACFSVISKERRRVPFFFNSVQRDFIEKLSTQGPTKPYFILKGRQQGFTTLITAIQLSYAIVRSNFSGFTVADREDNAKTIFSDKAKVMLDLLPNILKPHAKLNSSQELYFDKLNSSWRIGVATPNVGRSRTLSFIHFSEIAFYRCPLGEIQMSMQEAATSDALIIYETTANGFNDAKTLWNSGSCHNLFYEWWKTDEYRSSNHEVLKTADKWLSERLKALKERGLDDDQLAWYGNKYNSYIDKNAIKQEYPCSPEEAFIVSGDSIFDKDAIGNYLSNFKENATQGRFEYEKILTPITDGEGKVISYSTTISNIKFVPDRAGFIKIAEEPYIVKADEKIVKKPYVIGADTAGTGEDYFAAKVIDNTTGKCVATLHKQRIDEDLFAEQLYCLGKYYGDALIGIEINYSRHPVNVLLDLGYTNLYSQSFTTNNPFPPQKRYGFMTTYVTRPIIISHLVTVMRENLFLETDRETLNEMCSFIRHSNGKCAGARGSHDDLVIASAIAHYIGQYYRHETEIIDTGSSVFEKSFTHSSPQDYQILEW